VEIHEKSISKEREDRREALKLLKTHFSNLQDKDQAWQDLHRLTHDEYSSLRRRAAGTLGSAFSQVPDKCQAWQDLIRLTKDEDSFVRGGAARALGLAFSQIPDKDQAWQDLHRLTQDDDSNVRIGSAGALGSAFTQVPDKGQAWRDLITLTQDENSSVRKGPAGALGSAFTQVPDKGQAWRDLITLTKDEDSFVRWGAAGALRSAFSQIPDKDQAWQDLFRLTKDEDNFVRLRAADALGSAFSQVPDKDQAWQDLITLTKDEDSNVRIYAYHSLGRASVLKATEAGDKAILRRELENAVAYFEKSAQEPSFFNHPAKFCHPFYRTYLAITFQDAKEDEVQSYLAEAKRAVGGSESKDELFKVVENLARALRESHCQKDKPVQEVASELNAYRWYCEKAAEYMAAAEDKAPGAVKLMRRGNPLLEDRIQATLAEIQEKARLICQITRGSDIKVKTPGAEIYRAAKALSEGDLVSIQRSSSSIVKQLKQLCSSRLPEEEKDQMCKVVEEIELEAYFPEKFHLIEIALGSLLKSHLIPLVDVVILTVLPEEYTGVVSRLSGLSLPQYMGSAPNIYAWKFGEIICPNHGGTYKVAVGMIGRAGDIQSALAAKEAISLWRPNYLIFSGIAGGLPDAGPKKGDVIIADCIYGYEYGKIEKKFKPRGNWAYKTDQGLLTGAIAYALQNNWHDHIKSKSPEECDPRVISGEIASGEKVVDDPTNEFFAQVIKMWPKVRAVEMEGAGIGSAIEQAQNLKIPVGFMVIRAISDLPRPKGDEDKTKGTKERDAWKAYSSDAAAAFTVGWIADGLPLPPVARN
jgi:HEAT repeat protein/nucleoside phosphorylase